MAKSKHSGREQFDKYIAATSYESFVEKTFETLAKKYEGKVFGKKKYVGKKSGHFHEIDVSVELELMGLQFIVLIECKFYKRFVEISDLLEFAHRIEDIGAHKGVVVSTLGFQEGAVKIANAHGIALITTIPVWNYLMYSIGRNDKSQAFYEAGFYKSVNGIVDDIYIRRSMSMLILNGVCRYVYFEDVWMETLGHLVDPKGDYNFNEYFLNQADHSEEIKKIEEKRKEENPNSFSHLFNKLGVCKKCGCDLRYINYFKNWNCRHENLSS